MSQSGSSIRQGEPVEVILPDPQHDGHDQLPGPGIPETIQGIFQGIVCRKSPGINQIDRI